MMMLPHRNWATWAFRSRPPILTRLTFSPTTLSGADADKFDIISENDVDTTDLDEEGQIRLKAGTKLNYESNKKTYMVTVTARDPSNAEGSIDVTIKVVDIDEPPEFTAPREGDVDKTIKENSGSLSIYSFRATDPEGRKVYWSLRSDIQDSPDMARFTITDKGVLSLREAPITKRRGMRRLMTKGSTWCKSSPPTTPLARGPLSLMKTLSGPP